MIAPDLHQLLEDLHVAAAGREHDRRLRASHIIYIYIYIHIIPMYIYIYIYIYIHMYIQSPSSARWCRRRPSSGLAAISVYVCRRLYLLSFSYVHVSYHEYFFASCSFQRVFSVFAPAFSRMFLWNLLVLSLYPSFIISVFRLCFVIHFCLFLCVAGLQQDVDEVALAATGDGLGWHIYEYLSLSLYM